MSKSLPKSRLGRTDLLVTRLGYGAAHNKTQTIYNAKKIHDAILTYGINYIDTADDYGNSEDLIGEYLSEHISKFYIATKCGAGGQDPRYFGGSPSGHILTRENCMRTLEESLRRMRLEYVDIMQIHSISASECESNDLVEVLDDMKKQGKVRWIGASTSIPDIATFLEWGVFDVFQLPYSALERDHENWITKAAEAGIGTVIRGGIALGEPGIDKGGDGSADSQRTAKFWQQWPNRWKKFDEAGLDELIDIGDDRTSFVLRFTLSHPHIDTMIVGTTKMDHLKANVNATLKGPLPQNVYDEAKRRLNAVGIRAIPI